MGAFGGNGATVTLGADCTMINWSSLRQLGANNRLLWERMGWGTGGNGETVTLRADYALGNWWQIGATVTFGLGCGMAFLRDKKTQGHTWPFLAAYRHAWPFLPKMDVHCYAHPSAAERLGRRWAGEGRDRYHH